MPQKTAKLLTHDEFKSKRLGKFIDNDGAYGYQCVDVPRQYCLEVYGFVMGPVGGSAKNASLGQTFKNDSRRKEYKPGDPSMSQGDILISAPTKTNSHGHIGIVDYINDVGYGLLEQNTKGGGTKTKGNEVKVRLVKRGHPPILRFFKFTKATPPKKK